LIKGEFGYTHFHKAEADRCQGTAFFGAGSITPRMEVTRITANPTVYADPANLLKLPFSNNYEEHPYDRFKLDTNQCFDYMGRRQFLDIYQAVVSMELYKKN